MITWKRLDVEEEKISLYLEKHHPGLQMLYTENLERGRKGILHRLIQAVVREGLLGEQVTIDHDDNGFFWIKLGSGKRIGVPVKRRFSFGRFDVAGELLFKDGLSWEVITHPVQLLDLLYEEGILCPSSVEQYERFSRELQNSVANYALAFALAESRKKLLQKEASAAGVHTSLDWVKRQLSIDPQFSPLQFFEQWVVDGHPIHPGAKLRMGMDTAEVLAFSPEAEAVVTPKILAVACSESIESSIDGVRVNELMEADYPGIEAHVDHHLQKKGINLDREAYRIIPVHPWQYEKVISRMYQKAISENKIVPIPDFPAKAAVLMSFRTLAPIQRRTDKKHHIKTALAIQTTGTIRTISPHTAYNGAIVSQLLKEILKKENHFNQRFYIIAERLGVFYSPSDDTLPKHERYQLQRNLVTVFRENLETEQKEGEIALPASALLAPSPISGLPIVAELIQEFSANQGLSTLEEAAAAFVDEYSRAALPGFLTLFTRYGISLEGHLQNSIPVFHKGSITRFYQRDFGGIRILRERLDKQGMLPAMRAGSITLTDDERDVRNKLLYPVFQNHFGELIAGLVRWLGMSEKALWQPVIATCRKIYASLKQDNYIGMQAARDEAHLFAETMELKAMGMMRLRGEMTTYSFSTVPNILAERTGNR